METEATERASSLAADLHAGQRYGDSPYTCHTSSVAFMLSEVFAGHTMRETLVCAGHLHDALEESPDPEAARQAILRELGPVVLEIVKAVTDEPGRNRAERAQRTHPKIAAAGWKAVAVKLADRACNVRTSVKGSSHLLSMYRKEYPAFQAGLRHVGADMAEIASMWAALDACLAP